MLEQNIMATHRGRVSLSLMWSSGVDCGALGGNGDLAPAPLRGPQETARCGGPWRPRNWRLLSLVLADPTPTTWNLQVQQNKKKSKAVPVAGRGGVNR
jgi:hypothetical protein